ncbi:MAG: hypothetical protein ACOC3S_01560 [Bacteroidota bacterium]
MKILLLFGLLHVYVYQQEDFRNIFTFDYQWAVNFMENNKRDMRDVTNDFDIENSVVIPVLFPEVVRFSLFKNYMETLALEVLYVKFGSDDADFSIGIFQMKPSFVENLEEFIDNNHDLKKKYDNIISFHSVRPKKVREERIRRLKTVSWQLIYAAAFYDVVQTRFPDKKYHSKEDKIRFFASAYNHGFTKSEKEIELWIDRAVFPYGMKSTARQYSYSSVSVYFYKNEYMEIFE